MRAPFAPSPVVPSLSSLVASVALRRLGALFALALVVLSTGCSAEYYARRQARREQRLAERAARRDAQLAQQEDEAWCRCTSTQVAFEQGNNDGLGHHAMDSSWIAQCPPEYQAQQYQAYNSGYQQGSSYAGQQVVVVGPRATSGGQVYVSSTAGGVSCRFSSDCGGSSMSCRSWGGGGNVCMGNGYSGAPCWFGSDCLSGWCDGAGQSRTCR